MKIKLDADSLKELCLNHLEKVIFAFFVLFFLMTVWSSLGLKGLDKKPSELQNVVTRAKENLEREQEVATPVEDYLTMVDTITKPIQLEELETPVAWNPPLFPARKKREEPQILAMEDLQVVSGRGKVNRSSGSLTGSVSAMMEEEDEEETEEDYYEATSSSSTRGLHWCIVTGAIPYKKQEEAFLDALGGAGQLTPRDEPTYYSYQVERAEVPLDGDMGKLQWEKLDISPKGENFQIAKEIGAVGGSRGSGSSGISGDLDAMYDPPQLMIYPRLRSNTRMETVRTGNTTDDRGLVPSNTYTFLNPLPPVSSGSSTINWNKIIPYPEGIRVLTAAQKRNQQRGNQRVVEELDEYADEDETGELVEETLSSQEMSQELRKAPRRLFRFVDYTVQPGVQYCYRVKLRLHNPNFNYKPTHYVSNESLTKEKYLESAWSEPSTVATVIRDERFLVGGIEMVAEKPTDRLKVPNLSLMLVKFDEETGDELSAFFKYLSLDSGKTKRVRGEVQRIEIKQSFQPGQQLTLSAKPSELTSLTGASGMSSPSSRGMGMQYGMGMEEEEEARVFDTGFVLLDVMGGNEELYRGVTITKDLEGPVYAQAIKDYPDAIYTPVRALLMNADGELVIQSELSDLPEVYPRVPKIDRNMMSEMETQETPRRSSRKKKNTEGGSLLDRRRG
ncbi:MAG: hypothetical protein Q4D62_04765 [Planctomycetia bacterium]|nr:hypothetical protein [Planctomycetia bacterium]